MTTSPQRIGRYDVRRVLGQGAMGVVYEALDPLIERVVAVKAIPLRPEAAERNQFQTRFFREAKSAGKLNHPAIVTVYDVGEDDHHSYIAMEFLHGQTLRAWLDSGAVLPLTDVRKIAASLAHALDYAHAHGVVHRDIKPANIMVAPDRSVKLMDFGIAQLQSSSQTLHGTVLGSPTYMAPEQVAGRAVDGRTDVFALGAVIYEMLTGRVPFDGESMATIMYKIVHDEAPVPSELNRRVPAAFEAIVMRAMAKDPAHRFQRARDFAHALEALELRSAVISDSISVPAASRNSGVDATVVLQPVQERLAKNLSVSPAQLPVQSNDFTSASAAYVRRFIADHRWWPLAASAALMLTAFALWHVSEQRPRVAKSSAVPLQTARTTAASVESQKINPVVAPSSTTTAAPSPLAVAGASPPSPGPVRVALAIYPWGEVWVNGKLEGVSPPLNELRLPPGAYEVEIRNAAKPSHRESVVIAAGENNLRIRHRFQ